MKVGGDNVVKRFQDKFKELRVERHRKESNSSALVMFTEEDEYIEDDEEFEEDNLDDNDDEQKSQDETEDKEIYFRGTQSQARKRFGRINTFCSRQPLRNTYNR